MRIQITQEDKLVAEEILRELVILQKELSKKLYNGLIFISNVFLRFIYSYQEYSIANIKKNGIGEVLWNRAIRFFGLANDKDESKNKVKSSNKKRIVRRVFIKIGKTVLLPAYLILLLIDFLRNKKRKVLIKENKYVKHNNIE